MGWVVFLPFSPLREPILTCRALITFIYLTLPKLSNKKPKYTPHLSFLILIRKNEGRGSVVVINLHFRLNYTLVLNCALMTNSMDSTLYQNGHDHLLHSDQLCLNFPFLRNNPKLYSLTMQHLWSLTEKIFNANILF